MKFGVYIEVEEWCTKVCRMTRFKVKVKVTGLWSSKKCTFQSLSTPPLTEGAGKWPLILKLEHDIQIDRAGFLKFVLVFVSHDLELGGVPAVSPSRRKFFFRFQWNLVCPYRSMTDARRYAVWPDSRSRSRSMSRSRRQWSSENCTFPTLSPPPFTMAAGKWPLILKLQHNIEIWSAGFSIFVLVFVTWPWTWCGPCG